MPPGAPPLLEETYGSIVWRGSNPGEVRSKVVQLLQVNGAGIPVEEVTNWQHQQYCRRDPARCRVYKRQSLAWLDGMFLRWAEMLTKDEGWEEVNARMLVQVRRRISAPDTGDLIAAGRLEDALEELDDPTDQESARIWLAVLDAAMTVRMSG
jgi:hypothetical protein